MGGWKGNSNAQWPWKKRASCFGWLTLKGNPSKKQGKKEAPHWPTGAIASRESKGNQERSLGEVRVFLFGAAQALCPHCGGQDEVQILRILRRNPPKAVDSLGKTFDSCPICLVVD